MFSVIIPIFNKEKILTQSISSVLNQTYTSFELILIDDGSTDNSAKVVKEILEKNSDKRILFFQKKNSGPSAARNLGMRKAHFPYVAFLDADDEWQENYLFEINRIINKYPEAGIYACRTRAVYPRPNSSSSDSSSSPKGYEVINPSFKERIIYDFFNHESNGEGFVYGSNFVVRKKTLLGLGGFNEKISLFEDREAIYKIAFEQPVAYSDLSTVTYNKEYSNLSKIKNHNLNRMADYMVNFLITSKGLVQEKQKSYFRLLIEKEILIAAMNSLLLGNKKTAWVILKNKHTFSFNRLITKLIVFLLLFSPTKVVRLLYKKRSPHEYATFFG